MTAAQTATSPARIKGCCQALADPIADATAAYLADLFKALADPTRVQMVHMLKAASQPVCVCDFTATFELGQPTVSHHLGRLREAGLVRSFKRGIWTFHELNPDMPAPGRAAIDLLP
jgi:ArsR family transcriptional regulator, arsenate/arsenite/antimonite-responsive transcriptional repressor